MANDGGNLKRNFEREGVVVAEVAYLQLRKRPNLYPSRDVRFRETYTFDSRLNRAMDF